MIQTRESSESASELVLERLLGEILSSRVSPGMRLPAERELAARYETSRVTIREALQKLVEWGVITIRRGSGAIVRDRVEWSFQVLPAYLVHGTEGCAPATIRAVFQNVLQLRRATLMNVFSQAQTSSTQLNFDEGRSAVSKAWKARARPLEFIQADFSVLRIMLQELNQYPAIWFLNDFARAYVKLFDLLSGKLQAPRAYVSTHTQVFSALEAGQFQEASRIYGELLDLFDSAIMNALPAAPQGVEYSE